MKNQIAIHPTVSHTIARVLAAHGFPKDEIERVIAQVTTRAIEAVEGRRRGPRTIDAWQVVAARAAQKYAAEERGKTPVHAEIDLVGDVYEDDGGRPDPEQQLLWCLFGDPRAQTGKQIAVLLDMLMHDEMPEKAREILASLGDGGSAAETARTLGLTPGEVRGRLREMRTRFFRRLAQVGLLHATFDDPVGSETETEKR